MTKNVKVTLFCKKSNDHFKTFGIAAILIWNTCNLHIKQHDAILMKLTSGKNYTASPADSIDSDTPDTRYQIMYLAFGIAQSIVTVCMVGMQVLSPLTFRSPGGARSADDRICSVWILGLSSESIFLPGLYTGLGGNRTNPMYVTSINWSISTGNDTRDTLIVVTMTSLAHLSNNVQA